MCPVVHALTLCSLSQLHPLLEAAFFPQPPLPRPSGQKKQRHEYCRRVPEVVPSALPHQDLPRAPRSKAQRARARQKHGEGLLGDVAFKSLRFGDLYGEQVQMDVRPCALFPALLHSQQEAVFLALVIFLLQSQATSFLCPFSFTQGQSERHQPAWIRPRGARGM